MHRPYPQTQPPRDDPAEKLILVEISAKLFSSWADGFSEVLPCHDHEKIFRLALWVCGRAISISAPIYLEQVNGNDGVFAYRFWIPLREMGAASFSIECSTVLPEIEKKPEKRARMDEEPPHRLDPVHIASRSDLAAAFRLYQEGRPPVFDEIDFDREELPNHILAVLSAEAYFDRPMTQLKYQKNGVVHRSVDLYTEDGIFSPPAAVVEAGLIRRMTVGPAGFLKHPLSLLEYALPIHRPPRALLIEKFRAVLNTTGGFFEEGWENLDEDELIGVGNRAGIFSDPAL